MSIAPFLVTVFPAALAGDGRIGCRTDQKLPSTQGQGST